MNFVFIEFSFAGPNPPNSVTAINIAETIEIEWSRPIYPILQFIDNYKISVEKNGKITNHTVEKDVGSFVFRSCTPGSQYSITMSTYTTNNVESKPSPAIEIQTEGKISVLILKT